MTDGLEGCASPLNKTNHRSINTQCPGIVMKTIRRCYRIWIFGAAAIVLASAVVAVGLGASVGAALLLVAASPALIVVAYETVGYRHEEQALKQAEA